MTARKDRHMQWRGLGLLPSQDAGRWLQLRTVRVAEGL